MGNSSSVQKGKDDVDKFDGIETLGYRVLGVQPNSPAAKAGLVSFLDFLVGADRKMLLGSGEDLQEGEEYDDVDLPAMLQEYLNKPLELCK
jgi:GRASP55/65 PDZ-like domain